MEIVVSDSPEAGKARTSLYLSYGEADEIIDHCFDE